MSLWVILLQLFFCFVFNEKTILKLTAFSSPNTSDYFQRHWASELPKPKSHIQWLFPSVLLSLLLFISSRQFCDGGTGAPLRPKDAGVQATHGGGGRVCHPPSIFPLPLSHTGGWLPHSADRLPPQRPTLPAWMRRPAPISSTTSALSRYSMRWVQSSRVVWLSAPRMHLCSRWWATSASTAARGSSRR